MKMDSLLEAFERYMHVEKNLSPHTRRNYSRDLCHFGEFLQHRHPRLALAIVLVVLLVPVALIEPRTYLTLTVAGLAMGMLIYLVASGLTLIFGLMDVLNFAHGAVFSWGAYTGFATVMALNGRWGWVDAGSVGANVAALLAASWSPPRWPP